MNYYLLFSLLFILGATQFSANVFGINVKQSGKIKVTGTWGNPVEIDVYYGTFNGANYESFIKLRTSGTSVDLDVTTTGPFRIMIALNTYNYASNFVMTMKMPNGDTLTFNPKVFSSPRTGPYTFNQC